MLAPIPSRAMAWPMATNANPSRPAGEKHNELLVERTTDTVQEQSESASRGTGKDISDDGKGCGNSDDSGCPPKKCPPGHGDDNGDGKKNCRKHKSGDDGDSRAVPVERLSQVS